MADTKLTALTTGGVADYIYGTEGGVSKKYISDGIVNVKNYGAVGDGSTNDTAAIQAAFDAAFGTWASPNGISNTKLNKAVWFPNGSYKCDNPVAAKTVSAAAAEAVTGYVRLTLNNTTSLANGDIVYVRGVVGVTNIADGMAATINNVDATHITLVSIAFSGSYSSGGTVRPPCLRIKDVNGGKIFGAGKGGTGVFTSDTNCALLSVNGWSYSTVSDVYFSSGAGGIAFDLNGDGGAAIGGSTTVQSQSSLFVNCGFGGGASVSAGGDYAVTIGMGQSMGSEMTFMDCYVATGVIAGLAWFNFNALAGTVIGGNIGGNNPSNPGAPAVAGTGIKVNAGACPIIHGVSFQSYNGIDVNITNSSYDAYCITGCRSESENFVKGPSVSNMTIFIGGCSMTSPHTLGTGYFYSGAGHVDISGCISAGGHYVEGANAYVTIKNCEMTDATYLTAGSNENYAYLEVIPQRILTETTTARSDTAGADASARVQFTNGGASTYTILKNSDTTTRLVAGNWIEVQQYGAGQVTITPASGVTLHSANGLKTRAQYSVVRITVDSTSDVFTVSGDTAV